MIRALLLLGVYIKAASLSFPPRHAHAQEVVGSRRCKGIEGRAAAHHGGAAVGLPSEAPSTQCMFVYTCVHMYTYICMCIQPHTSSSISMCVHVHTLHIHAYRFVFVDADNILHAAPQKHVALINSILGLHVRSLG